MATIPTPEYCAHEILSIFVTKFNRRPGEYLPINSFYEEMEKRRFRMADFQSGIKYAVTQGWIEILSDGTSYRLLEAGYMAATNPINVRNAETYKSDHADTARPTSTDRHFMERAIELSRRCRSETGKVSPKVGAVIVRDGKIIGEAYRGQIEPGEHAEYTLLEKHLPDETLAGTTLYVTLEPCTTRNDPKIACANRVKERRIKKVFIGVLDPNPDICGSGELFLRDGGIEIARFDSDLMAIIEELNRDFTRQHETGGRINRTNAQKADPVEPNQVGPNGFRIGYTDNGDKVEWIPDDEEPDKEWPMILRRSDNDILAMYDEFWDKVWWNRHMVWIEKIERGDVGITGDQQAILDEAKLKAREIEQRYGRDNLGWDDFEWGLISGRLSALAWVMGAEWNESLDT